MCCADRLAAALLAFFGSAAVTLAAAAPPLSQADLQNPQAVGNWLKLHRSSAPREQANTFFQLGDKAFRARRWGAASKGYGESALLYPSPEALSAYARALLNERAVSRTTHPGANPPGRPAHAEAQQADWREASALLTTALAADDQLHTMKRPQRDALAADAACLARAAEGQPDPATCAPLRQYRSLLGR